MQSAPPAEAQQWAQQQQAYKDSVRTSTPAEIQTALQNFNGVQMNPSKLYAPGAPKSNNAPLTPEQQPQTQQQAPPVATPQALGPATVVCELPHKPSTGCGPIRLPSHCAALFIIDLIVCLLTGGFPDILECFACIGCFVQTRCGQAKVHIKAMEQTLDCALSLITLVLQMERGPMGM